MHTYIYYSPPPAVVMQQLLIANAYSVKHERESIREEEIMLMECTTELPG